MLLGYQIEPGNPQSAAFVLANFGQGPLRYRWVLDDAAREKHGIHINFSSSAGVVERQSTQILEVFFTVAKYAELKDYLVRLQVRL